MSAEEPPPDADSLNREVREIWDRNAPWWDERIGEGNKYQTLLIGPATERLLELRPGEVILDVACGNGAFSRRMAEAGARVVAFDFSERMLERARERTTEFREAIETGSWTQQMRASSWRSVGSDSTPRCAPWRSWTWRRLSRSSRP